MPGVGYNDFDFVSPTTVAGNRVYAAAGAGRQALASSSPAKAPPTNVMTSETVVVEEMKIYTHMPWAWWLFVAVAVPIFAIGVVNVIFCIELHFYCCFWTSILVSICDFATV